MIPNITFTIQTPSNNNTTVLPIKFIPPPSHNTNSIDIPIQQNIQQSTNPNKYVNNYVIDYNREIGHGNFSHVYAAIDKRQPNLKLAVKVVNVQSLKLQNLQHLIKSQVQVLLAVRHQNILLCKDAFWDDKFCYIFTEFCQKGSLQSKIHKAIPITQNKIMQAPMLKFPNLSEKQMLPIIKDVFQGLLYLQKKHIIHRDIKAANIFLKENCAVIADFGFARYVYEPFNDLNIGSLPFMPPEALTKNLYSNKTDVWAFGILIYQIFHGESPFAKSRDIKQLVQKVHLPMNVTMIRNDLSKQMKQLILNCLDIDWNKRKLFAEIQKSWYYKKLFQNLGQYNYGIRVNRVNQLSNNKSINILQGGSTASSLNEKELISQPNNNYLNLSSRTIIGDRPYGYASRFKVKFNGFTDSKMDYSRSKSKENISTQIKKPQIIQINTPTRLTSNKNINPTNSTIKIQAISPVIIKSNPMTVQQPQKNLVSQSIKIQPQKSIQKIQKISFKQILIKIQQIRNFYKLAIILKDRNLRLTQIKNRLFIKTVKEINKIENLILNDKIDLSAYDISKVKQKQKQVQFSNINNRKAKLSSIIKDYKVEFQTQLKRRSLSLNNNSQFLTEKDIPQDNKINNGGSPIKIDANFKTKTPTLSQDIQYIMQTELQYHAQDSFKMTYEQYQTYKSKIKQVLQDIIKSDQGFSGLEPNLRQQRIQKNLIIPQYDNQIISPGAHMSLNVNNKAGKINKAQQLSKVRGRQKSTYS